ncbi:MAG: RIO1 family regulatory kinase/ATPase [Thermodesulfobacteriota bacterium]
MILRQATSTRPLIRVEEEDGGPAIVKDFSANGFLFRNIVGRFLIWREVKAYRKLEGVRGVPRLLRIDAGPSLVVEAITGMDLKQAIRQRKVGSAFFDALKALVDRIHERGMAHCDLKASGNILVGQDGNPYIIDWGASISAGEFRWPVLNRIYGRFLVDDCRAITKHKLRCCPDAVGPEEKEQYDYRSRAEKSIRAIRDRLRSFIQAIF